MKKKRQSEPYGDIDNESTESCDDNQNKTICNHIQKAVDLSKLKKALKNGLDVECSECRKKPNKEENCEGDCEYDLSLWICLKCGNQACGRYRNQHALEHFKKPHSDSHAISVNTTTWLVWCYECDNEIPPNSKRKLQEVYEYVKKQSTVKNSPQIESNYNSTITFNEQVMENKDKMQIQNEIKSNNSLVDSLPRVRGLANLGNTCFFNAVLQCLAQTPFLVPVLKQMSEKGEKFRLPGGTFKHKDHVDELPPIEGELASWGSLTEQLAIVLETLQCSGGVTSPKKLLSLLSIKMPQFGGGDQEDSHELLRHLLEAVRTEDLKRYRRVILDKFGLQNADPSTVDEITTQKAKFYDLQVSNMILRPEQVFRGVLISTLQCQDCQHTSTREESFLDLSLPITPDKPQLPILRRKSELDEDHNAKPSKHQLKKERQAARKAAKKNKHLHKNQDGSEKTITEENQLDQSGGESEQSDADVEDNLEDATKILSTPDDKSDCNVSEKVDSPEKLDKSPVMESQLLPMAKSRLYLGYDNSNYENKMDEYNNQVKNKEKIERNSPNVSNSSECSELSDSPVSPQTPTDSRNDVSPDEVSSATGGGATVAPETPAVIALGWRESPPPEPSKPAVDASPIKDIFSYNHYEDNRLVTSPVRAFVDNSSWSSTVGARYRCEDNECSIQSCLNQFTTVELMTGNNKVCCEMCTKRINENKEDAKNIYTNSTKQLLIANPPPVLILHLKRFQVFRSLFRKMSKIVSFPLLLDLAPFCSNKCKNLPTISNQQKRLLYSLYGIVEHSGTLNGGHYVAYVKVRHQLEPNDYRWQFLPSSVGSNSPPNNCSNSIGSNDLSQTSQDNSNQKMENGEVSEPLAPPGKWYYVSDSQVNEVPESRVLKAQAYLLFYERIL